MNVMKGPFIRNITTISAASDVEEIQEVDGNGGHEVPNLQYLDFRVPGPIISNLTAPQKGWGGLTDFCVVY